MESTAPLAVTPFIDANSAPLPEPEAKPAIPEQPGERSYSQTLIYGREALFDQIHRDERLDEMIVYFVLRAAAMAGIYGGCLGFYALNFQILAAALKIPFLLLATPLVCLPALFTFNVLLGSKLQFRQTLAVLALGTYLTCLVLGSLAPILLFFVVSTPDRPFVFLLNLASLSIAGGFGMSLTWSGLRYLTARSGVEFNTRIVLIWSVLYMFVGTQMSWMLRPFVGSREEFVFLRHIHGNFYTAVFNVLLSLFQ